MNATTEERLAAVIRLRRIMGDNPEDAPTIYTLTTYGRGETDHVRLWVIEDGSLTEITYYAARAMGSKVVPYHWRHGGWYWSVATMDAGQKMFWPGGGSGCVSRQMLNPETGKADRKWRIVCDPRSADHTYANRDDAARAEWELMREAHQAIEAAESAAQRGEPMVDVIRGYLRATPYAGPS